jgi:hypothetical protein
MFWFFKSLFAQKQDARSLLGSRTDHLWWGGCVFAVRVPFDWSSSYFRSCDVQLRLQDSPERKPRSPNSDRRDFGSYYYLFIFSKATPDAGDVTMMVIACVGFAIPGIILMLNMACGFSFGDPKLPCRVCMYCTALVGSIISVLIATFVTAPSDPSRFYYETTTVEHQGVEYCEAAAGNRHVAVVRSALTGCGYLQLRDIIDRGFIVTHSDNGSIAAFSQIYDLEDAKLHGNTFPFKLTFLPLLFVVVGLLCTEIGCQLRMYYNTEVSALSRGETRRVQVEGRV